MRLVDATAANPLIPTKAARSRRRQRLAQPWIAWTLVGWLAAGTPALALGASLSSADFASNGVITLSLFDVASAVCGSIRNPPSLDGDAAALYLESGFRRDEELIRGRRWYDSNLYSVRLSCLSAPWALRFGFTSPSEEEFVFSLEALDGEPLEAGVFATSYSNFRINQLEWDDVGRRCH